MKPLPPFSLIRLAAAMLAVPLLSPSGLAAGQPPAKPARRQESTTPQTPPEKASSGTPTKKRRTHVIMNPDMDEVEALILEEATLNTEANSKIPAVDRIDEGEKEADVTAPRPEIPDSRSVSDQARRTRMEGKHTIGRAVRLFKAKGQGGRWKDKLMTALIVGGGGLLALVGCLALMRRRH